MNVFVCGVGDRKWLKGKNSQTTKKQKIVLILLLKTLLYHNQSLLTILNFVLHAFRRLNLILFRLGITCFRFSFISPSAHLEFLFFLDVLFPEGLLYTFSCFKMGQTCFQFRASITDIKIYVSASP